MASRHSESCLTLLCFAVSIKSPFDSAILSLEIYPTEIFIKRLKDTGTRMFPAAWEAGNKLNGLKKVLLNKSWPIHTMEYNIQYTH